MLILNDITEEVLNMLLIVKFLYNFFLTKNRIGYGVFLIKH